ncbi:MAG: gfo/Idh/MocA family oxidoreductase, partial [Pseudomonadota bacterium]|nr:gfo/Idh/MocA family oxidoreductase [Pseudomonadota bacterium]
AVRANQKGKADGVPGINSGIRGMVFIDAMLASTDSDTKWESVSQEGTQ